jgi:hypothetical protein
MHQLTAAHRELPLGTWIVVANLDNGRAVEVRINDRGPFVRDRIVDVSYAAGRLLGMIGPGAIMLSLSIGSGEWLMGPAAAVQYGPMLMWITTIACVTQTFFNLECIRYAAYCGEPMMIGYNRLKPGRWIWGPFWIITCVICIGPGWAITSATALSAILLDKMPGGADKNYVMVVGILLTAIVLFMLLWGRKVENTLEKISWAIVAFIVCSLVILIIGWVPGEAIWRTTKGFFMFGAIPQGADPVLLGGFAAYSAAGGIFNISSSNWFRDKGYAMGKEVGFISGAIGGEKINLSPIGIAFKPTAENLKKWKNWLHFARIDQWILFGFGCWLGMWLTVTFAVGMIPPGTKLAGWAVAAYQGEAIRKILGASGSKILAMMTGEFIRWVGIANLLAWPVGFLVMKKWLEGFAFRTGIAWWLFPAAGAAAQPAGEEAITAIDQLPPEVVNSTLM